MSFFRAKRQAERDRADTTLRDLIEATNNGDLEAGYKLAHESGRYIASVNRLGLHTPFLEAQQQYFRNKRFSHASPAITADFERWQEAMRKGEFISAAHALARLTASIRTALEYDDRPNLVTELGIDMEDAKKRYQELVQRRWQQLVTAAETSFDDFLKLREFIRFHLIFTETKKYVGYPDNWNELVIKHIEHPRFQDFVGLKQYTAHRTYWLDMAARAKANTDVTLAKQVIAVYESVDPRHVSPAMAVLVSDLAVMFTLM